MAVALRSQSVLTYASHTNPTITAPGTIANGDILVLLGITYGAPGTPTPPAGFAAVPGSTAGLLRNQAFGTQSEQLFAWTKVASSESGNYAITQAVGSSAYWMGSFSGADTGAPIPNTWSNNGASGAVTTSTALSVTPTRDGSQILIVSGDNADTSNVLTVGGAGSTPTFNVDVNGSLVLGVANGPMNPAGATGNKTWTNNTTGAGGGYVTAMLVLQPPPPTSGGQRQLPVKLGPRAVGPVYFSDTKPRNIPDPVITSWTENWVNASRWVNAGGAVTVSAGKVFGATSPLTILQRPIVFGPGRQASYLARLHWVDPGAGFTGQIGLYVTAETPSQMAAGVATAVFYFFVDLAAAGLRVVLVDVNGTIGGATQLRTGNRDYLMGITVDDTYTSAFIRSADGIEEQRTYVLNSFAGFTPTSVGLALQDNRGTNGCSFGPVSYNGGSLTPAIPNAGTGDLTATIINRQIATQECRIAIPTTYDPATPCPLVVYGHGGGGAYTEIQDIPQVQPMGNALLNMGCMVVSSDDGGPDTFGNQASLDQCHALYQYCLQHFNVGKIILIGYSMGGQMALLVGDGRIPINGYIGLAPLCNLAYANVKLQSADPLWSPHLAQFEAAYGLSPGYSNADYLAATAGHDPMLLPVNSWNGIPMLISDSCDDPAVDYAQNGELFFNQLLVGGHTGALYQHFVGSNTHNGDDQFPPTLVTNFVRAALNGAPYPAKLEPDPIPQPQPMLPEQRGPRAVGPKYFARPIRPIPPPGVAEAPLPDLTMAPPIST